MSAEWWKAAGVFALAMMALSFVNQEAAIAITLAVGFAAIVLRLGANQGKAQSNG